MDIADSCPDAQLRGDMPNGLTDMIFGISQDMVAVPIWTIEQYQYSPEMYYDIVKQLNIDVESEGPGVLEDVQTKVIMTDRYKFISVQKEVDSAPYRQHLQPGLEKVTVLQKYFYLRDGSEVIAPECFLAKQKSTAFLLIIFDVELQTDEEDYQLLLQHMQKILDKTLMDILYHPLAAKLLYLNSIDYIKILIDAGLRQHLVCDDCHKNDMFKHYSMKLFGKTRNQAQH